MVTDQLEKTFRPWAQKNCSRNFLFPVMIDPGSAPKSVPNSESKSAPKPAPNSAPKSPRKSAPKIAKTYWKTTLSLDKVKRHKGLVEYIGMKVDCDKFKLQFGCNRSTSKKFQAVGPKVFFIFILI